MVKNKNAIFLIVAILVFFCSSPTQAAVKVGEPAPDFTAKDTNEKQWSLSDYKGKFIVLEWINHDCPFVRKHYGSGHMQKLQKEYTEKGVVWLSVSSSAPGKQGHYPAQEANQLTKEKGARPTAVLLDFEGNVGRLYGAKTTPHIFIIDPQGSLIYQGAIDNIPSTDIADIEKADNYVALALDSALAGKPFATSSTKSYGCSVKY
jgi:peroxiredoxin